MQGQPQLEYDANKLYKTAAYYFGSIAIVFTAAPTPELKAVGVVIVYFLDILGSVLGEIFGKPLVSSAAK
jgi:VIT1/CCC1 family predicted Fe2+/Mn2+ transporter